MDELVKEIQALKANIAAQDFMDVEYLGRSLMQLCDLFAVYVIAEDEANRGTLAALRRLRNDDAKA